MNIEFQAPQGQVKEWLINHVRNELMKLYHKDKEISRAAVYFREKANDPFHDRICEIDLAIYGDSVFVHRKADSYEQAAREALAELAQKVDTQMKKQNEPPDEVTSTVKV